MSDRVYEWLLFAHIVAAMVWVGGAVLLGVLAARASRDVDPDAVGRFLSNMRFVGPVVLAPATFAVLGFGVWLVLDSTTWDFGQRWVQLALALFAGAFVIGAAHQSRAAIGAERAADRGDHDEARRQLVRWSSGYWAIVALLIVAVWDMTTKPGL
jgi:putative copper export protein